MSLNKRFEIFLQKDQICNQICKHYKNVIRTLVFMVLFGIFCNFFIALSIWLKICGSNCFLYLYKAKWARRKNWVRDTNLTCPIRTWFILSKNDILLWYIRFLAGRACFNPLTANFAKWSNTLKQFVGFCRRIVWVGLTILWVWCLKGSVSMEILGKFWYSILMSLYIRCSLSSSAMKTSFWKFLFFL